MIGISFFSEGGGKGTKETKWRLMQETNPKRASGKERTEEPAEGFCDEKGGDAMFLTVESKSDKILQKKDRLLFEIEANGFRCFT